MIEFGEILRELERKLRELAGIAGTGCIWKVSGYLLPEPDLERRFSQHTCEFCAGVKTHGDGEKQCVYHDTRELVARLRQHTAPFVGTCHAGAVEIIVPLPPETAGFAGAVMLGPFRTEGTECRYPELEALYRQLPVLRSEAAEGYFDFIPAIFSDIIHRAYAETGGLLPRRPRDKRILEVLEFLRLHSHENPTAVRTAELVFMSPSRLLHLFKLECGIGMGEYLLKLRLRKARRFLLAADWPISRVAEKSGFTDQSYFTSMFRREFGLPPLRYRRKHGHAPYTV